MHFEPTRWRGGPIGHTRYSFDASCGDRTGDRLRLVRWPDRGGAGGHAGNFLRLRETCVGRGAGSANLLAFRASRFHALPDRRDAFGLGNADVAGLGAFVCVPGPGCTRSGRILFGEASEPGGTSLDLRDRELLPHDHLSTSGRWCGRGRACDAVRGWRPLRAMGRSPGDRRRAAMMLLRSPPLNRAGDARREPSTPRSELIPRRGPEHRPYDEALPWRAGRGLRRQRARDSVSAGGRRGFRAFGRAARGLAGRCR